jgi:acyl dehydratase
MTTTLTLEELERAGERDLGATEWVTLDQERIDQFAEATGDHQWIHVDVERARRESPYGTTIAHGYLTLSLVPQLIKSVLRVEGLRASVNYGSNRVRYPAPVPAGARIRGRVRILEAADVPPDGLRVTYQTTVEMADSDRPVCIAETIAVHYR